MWQVKEVKLHNGIFYIISTTGIFNIKYVGVNYKIVSEYMNAKFFNNFLDAEATLADMCMLGIIEGEEF